ncbi:hypothetical protein N5U17_06145 [Aliarcobacter butzleri]|uniref:hypothetical protein n=1 Tax=Aliarcobacter butzleri TaxID=28197 RepID=UPI0021B16533|nr:hypothetical protein [Aliarcobacter butzleri]MCT7603810.1 hypothetical protein [Aliarcobacter butzleri]
MRKLLFDAKKILYKQNKLLIYTLDSFHQFDLDNLNQGDDGFIYEKYVGLVYESKGYKVKYNGLEKGVLDEGIDLEVSNSEKTVYIQCKYTKISLNRLENILFKASKFLTKRYEEINNNINDKPKKIDFFICTPSTSRFIDLVAQEKFYFYNSIQQKIQGKLIEIPFSFMFFNKIDYNHLNKESNLSQTRKNIHKYLIEGKSINEISVILNISVTEIDDIIIKYPRLNRIYTKKLKRLKMNNKSEENKIKIEAKLNIIEILNSLINGIHPISKEYLKDDIVLEPEIREVLIKIKEKIITEENNKKKRKPDNTGKRWSDEDIKTIFEMYSNGYSTYQISKEIKRTSYSVFTKLKELELIN